MSENSADYGLGIWGRIVKWFRDWPGAFTPICTGAGCPICAEINRVTSSAGPTSQEES